MIFADHTCAVATTTHVAVRQSQVRAMAFTTVLDLLCEDWCEFTVAARMDKSDGAGKNEGLEPVCHEFSEWIRTVNNAIGQ